MSRTILLVDDDALMRRSLAFHVEQAGYKVHTAANAEDALALVRHSPPDLVMLDIGLPGMDGLDALRELKTQYNLPVIFLTARRRELDEVVGLELGADDYITKPFDVDVVLAHIKAVLRRTSGTSQPEKTRLTVGDLEIDSESHTVSCAGKFLDLSPREFDSVIRFSFPARKGDRNSRFADPGLGRRIHWTAAGGLCPHPLAA